MPSSSRTRRSRVSAARGSRTRSPETRSPRSRAASPSATYSSGTTAARRPQPASASAVAGPMAATRAAWNASAPRPLSASRRRVMATPLTLVKITQRYSPARARAASSGAQESGPSITMVGTRTTRAPAASRRSWKDPAWAAARVTITTLPARGRAVSTVPPLSPRPLMRPGYPPWYPRSIAATRVEQGARAAREKLFRELLAERAPGRGRAAHHGLQHRDPVHAGHQPLQHQGARVQPGQPRHRRMAAGAEARQEGALRLGLHPGLSVVQRCQKFKQRPLARAGLHPQDALAHRGRKRVQRQGARARRLHTEPPQASPRHHQRVVVAGLELPQPRVHIAPDRLRAEVGPAAEEEHAPAQARGPHHPARRQVSEGGAPARHEDVGGVLA